MELKKTPFYERSKSAGGRIVDYCGWALPLEYSGVLDEAKYVRSCCGLFDVSHMGRIRVFGYDRWEFLQRLVSNDLSLIKEGGLQYNLLVNHAAGVIDDLIVYNYGNSYLCVVNAVNTKNCYQWFCENIAGRRVEIIDESLITALLSLQGPKSSIIMEKVFGGSIKDLDYMSFIEGKINNVNVIVSRSGYTGEDGFEICMPSAGAAVVWDVIARGADGVTIKPIGLGARDILRLEAGYPLYGHELSMKINPLEASLRWAVKLNKDFIGRDILFEINKAGIKNKRAGFIMEEKAVPRQGYSIYYQDKLIGEVSSGGYSPNLNKFIGMGYINTEFACLDTIVEIKIRDKFYKAKIVRFPFVETKTRRNKNERFKVHEVS